MADFLSEQQRQQAEQERQRQAQAEQERQRQLTLDTGFTGVTGQTGQVGAQGYTMNPSTLAGQPGTYGLHGPVYSRPSGGGGGGGESRDAQWRADRAANRTKPGAPLAKTQDWASAAVRQQQAAPGGARPEEPQVVTKLNPNPNPPNPLLATTDTQFTYQPGAALSIESPNQPNQPPSPNQSVSNQLLRENIFRNAMNQPSAQNANLRAIDQQLQTAAEAYRNAAPADRAQLRQQYADMLQAKVAGAREQAAGAGTFPSEAEKIAHYNDRLREHGIDPYMVGTARLNASGGMDVLSPQQEYAIRNQLNEGVKRQREMENAERVLIHKKDPESIAAAMRLREKRITDAVAQGFRNPFNPTAGLNQDTAFQTAASLVHAGVPIASLFEPRPVQEMNAAQPQLLQPAATPAESQQQQLDLLSSDENFKRSMQKWIEDQRRKQAQIMGAYGSAA